MGREGNTVCRPPIDGVDSFPLHYKVIPSVLENDITWNQNQYLAY